MFRIFLFCFLPILILSCRERDHTNPFDPDNDDPYLQIGLTVNSTDSLIQLSWYIPQDPDINGFEIYRRISGEGEFSLLALLDKTVSSYTDIASKADIRYEYFVRMLGDGVESSPTQVKSITPGPGQIWIVDDFLWEIYRVNYDLSSYALRKTGAWKPENLALAVQIGKGLVTYPAINYLEIFDLQSGAFMYGTSAINRPYDAVYDENLKLFWLIDSLGSLYQLDSTANHRLIGSFFGKPVQIDLLDDRVVILDKGVNSIFFFEYDLLLSDFIETDPDGESFENLALMRTDNINNKIYFLDRSENNNTIYKYNVTRRFMTAVFQDSLIRSFAVNKQDESIWIIIANKLNSDVVQLSGTGERLLTINGFNRPRDINVNPYNGNVIFTDLTEQINILKEKIFHYKSGELIGSFETYGDPFKVYIE